VRRLLSEVSGYAVALRNAVVEGWSAFFFTPADPTSLGLIRVAVGLLLLVSLGVFGLDLSAYFGTTGWADPEAVRFFHANDRPWAWSFWFWVPDSLLRPVWIACMAALILYTAGLFSRVTAVLAWIIVVSTARRAPIALFGFDQIVSMLALYLAATGASGQAISLDRFFRRYRETRASVAKRRHDGRWLGSPGKPVPTVSANLALRLIQLHLVLIYGMAGLAKLQGQGWWSGMAIWGVLASAEFREFDLTWLVTYPWLLNVMTHASLALELGYPALIWVRVLRPLLLLAIVFLHVGIALTAPGLTVFGLAMIAANVAFVPGSWLRSLWCGKEQPRCRVLYDGACPRCRASMALMSAADPDRLIEPVDLTDVDVTTIHPKLTAKACLEAMHVVRHDGRIAAGFDAVLAVARCVPVLWPAGVVGSLPILSHAGRRVYNRIAASRPRDVLCNDAVCGLHSTSRSVDSERTPP
jgi:predicted DCC family thiol-disulfide oxidoreductase YuxK